MIIPKLPCPVCRTMLDVDARAGYIACLKCGKTLEVKRRGDSIGLTIPLESSLAGVEKNTSSLASELAVARLKQDLAELDEKLATLQAKRAALAAGIVTVRASVAIGRTASYRLNELAGVVLRIVFAILIGWFSGAVIEAVLPKEPAFGAWIGCAVGVGALFKLPPIGRKAEPPAEQAPLTQSPALLRIGSEIDMLLAKRQQVETRLTDHLRSLDA